MKNRILKTLSVLGLALSTSFAFGWDVYEQAKNGNVARLQGTIPAYCPGGAYCDADNLQGALLVVEDYLNAFRAGSALGKQNLIYKYCHDENNMAETLDGVFKFYKNLQERLLSLMAYGTEDSMTLSELFNPLLWERGMKKSQKKNLQFLIDEYALTSPSGKIRIGGSQRQELVRVIYDIKEYLRNLELDENRLQQAGSHEFVANYHSKDNLKSRIKDAVKLREVVKSGLGRK